MACRHFLLLPLEKFLKMCFMFIYMYVSVDACCVCLCTCALMISEGGIGFPGATITGGRELPRVSAGN